MGAVCKKVSQNEAGSSMSTFLNVINRTFSRSQLRYLCTLFIEPYFVLFLLSFLFCIIFIIHNNIYSQQ